MTGSARTPGRPLKRALLVLAAGLEAESLAGTLWFVEPNRLREYHHVAPFTRANERSVESQPYRVSTAASVTATFVTCSMTASVRGSRAMRSFASTAVATVPWAVSTTVSRSG